MEESLKNTPLRILMTTDTVGGVWYYSIELCKVLEPFDVMVYLVTTGAPMQEVQKKEVEEVNNVEVFETGFMLEWMEAPWENIDASGAWLLQLEKDLLPDLIHLNCYAYGSLPWKAPVLVVAHSDVWSWWQSVKNELPPLKWNEYYKRVRTGLQHADIIIAPSKTMMRFIRSDYSITTPGKVIYNGRSDTSFFPAEKSAVIFSMGRIWDEAKNIQLLVDAAPRIPYQVKLAGGNSFGGATLTTEGTNITYLGKLSMQQVALELSVASLYVLPARYEPFGLSVLEAALSGCALVLGNISSLKEIWNDSAFYVDTGDAAALAKVVNNLMEDSSLRQRYAEKARQQAANYSTSQMCKNYLEVYSLLLRKSVYQGEIL